VPAQISALPTPPTANDPTNFNSRADTFLAALPAFATQANALSTELNANTTQVAADRVQTGSDRTAAAASAASALGAPGTNGSSTTSLTVGAGTKTFTTQAGKAWVAGQGFFLASSASPVNWMTGILTAYNSGTGAATVEVDTIGGSGTFAAWNCGLSAGRPIPVATQAQAEAGTDAVSWMTPQRTAQAAVVFGVPVGGVMQFAGNPGSRWLPCSGLTYLNSSYPALSTMLPAYVAPMTLRQSVSATGKMCFGAGLFIVWATASSSWYLYTSPDGVTWTQRTNPFGTGTPATCVTYGSGLFVAAANNVIYTSPDGITWTVRTSPFPSGWVSAIGAGASGFMLAGYNSQTEAFSFASSSNGTAWSLNGTENATQEEMRTVAYSASLSRWVCLGGTVGYYSNGSSTWNVLGITYYGGVQDLIWAAGRFVAVTANGQIIHSADGLSFGATSSNLGQALYAIVHDGVRFYAAGANGALGYSTDGVTGWTAMPSGIGTLTTITGVARTGNTPGSMTIIAAGPQGVRSGLDTSSTQFVAPTLSSAGAGLSPYIKAL